VMRRPPYASATGIFNRSMVRDIIWLGVFMALISLAVGYFYWQSDQATWQTMIFTTLTLAQMFTALGVRSERSSLLKTGLWSNRSMLGAVLLTFVLQLIVVYVPFFQSIFSTVALSGTDLALAVFVGFLVLVGIEIEKWFGRRGDRSQTASQKGNTSG
jgi:Ca2+-transporting ATPase